MLRYVEGSNKTYLEKLKSTATHLKSNDPTHRNGIKYSISIKQYDAIIDESLNRRCVVHMNKNMIREFINCKLKPIK